MEQFWRSTTQERSWRIVVEPIFSWFFFGGHGFLKRWVIAVMYRWRWWTRRRTFRLSLVRSVSRKRRKRCKRENVSSRMQMKGKKEPTSLQDLKHVPCCCCITGAVKPSNRPGTYWLVYDWSFFFFFFFLFVVFLSVYSGANVHKEPRSSRCFTDRWYTLKKKRNNLPGLFCFSCQKSNRFFCWPAPKTRERFLGLYPIKAGMNRISQLLTDFLSVIFFWFFF